jgi:hypothetical protein
MHHARHSTLVDRHPNPHHHSAVAVRRASLTPKEIHTKKPSRSSGEELACAPLTAVGGVLMKKAGRNDVAGGGLSDAQSVSCLSSLPSRFRMSKA